MIKVLSLSLGSAIVGIYIGTIITTGNDANTPKTPNPNPPQASSRHQPTPVPELTAADTQPTVTTHNPNSKKVGDARAATTGNDTDELDQLRAQVSELEGMLMRFEQEEMRISPQLDTPELRMSMVEEYFSLLDIDDQVNDSMRPMFQQMMSDVPENAKEEITDLIMSKFGWEAMKDDMVKIMVDVFDANDLKDIVNFQKSDVGIRLAQKQPEITQKMMENMSHTMQDLGPIREEINEIIEHYKSSNEAADS